MGFEARWENQMYQVACADTKEEAISTLLSITHGNGRIFLYEFGKDGKTNDTPIKIIRIED